jgi:hypothetical protein
MKPVARVVNFQYKQPQCARRLVTELGFIAEIFVLIVKARKAIDDKREYFSSIFLVKYSLYEGQRNKVQSMRML